MCFISHTRCLIAAKDAVTGYIRKMVNEGKEIRSDNELLKEVKDLGLVINLCQGQGYNGAGAVANIYNGMAALIRFEFKKLFLYTFQVIG